MKKFLTITEAAELLRLSPGTVYLMVSRKEIRHIRLGTGRRATIRIPEDALVEYSSARTVEASGPGEKPPTPRRKKTGVSGLVHKHLD